MGAFLENPMFLFMDDAEPVLPIFRSTEYGNTGRVVELTDVGCDTESTFPIHFSRSDRRRGGAESFGSTRRITKWFDRPNEFARKVSNINNNDGRNRNYIREKIRQDIRDYDDVPDLDFNDSYTQNPYDDIELSNLAVEKDNYTQFVNFQNTVANFHRERVSRDDYLARDLESPFKRNIHIPKKKNTSSRWLESNEKNVHEIHDINQSRERKRTKILSKTNGNFNCEAELEQTRKIAMPRERDDLPNAIDPVASSKNMFWDFISFENDDSECEQTTFYNPKTTKNHGKLQKIAPCRKRSYTFNSQPKYVDVIDSEGEEEFNKTLNKDSRENLSRIPINSDKYRTLKDDVVKEKLKILRLNTPNEIFSRGQSMKANEELSNMYFVKKDSINMRPHSATKGKSKLSNERREETRDMTGMTDDDYRYRNKFVNKVSNNSPKKTGRLTTIFNRITDSSNERIHTENERDNTNSHHGNVANNTMDQINVTISRLTPEKIITLNERTFASRMTDTSGPHTDVEKEKKRKFFSKLPIRTWKRLRTKEPAAFRPESDAMNENKGMETAKSNNHLERAENNDIHGKDRAANHDIKRSERFGIGSFNDKPRLTSSVLKNTKGIKNLNAVSGKHEQWKKRTNVKYT